MDKLKNWDVAAMATMLIALLLELAVWLATDASLLAKLPEPVVAFVFMSAAYARWRAEQPKPDEPEDLR